MVLLLLSRRVVQNWQQLNLAVWVGFQAWLLTSLTAVESVYHSFIQFWIKTKFTEKERNGHSYLVSVSKNKAKSGLQVTFPIPDFLGHTPCLLPKSPNWIESSIFQLSPKIVNRKNTKCHVLFHFGCETIEKLNFFLLKLINYTQMLVQLDKKHHRHEKKHTKPKHIWRQKRSSLKLSLGGLRASGQEQEAKPAEYHVICQQPDTLDFFFPTLSLQFQSSLCCCKRLLWIINGFQWLSRTFNSSKRRVRKQSLSNNMLMMSLLTWFLIYFLIKIKS